MTQWISIPQAAITLGITERALQYRVKKGTIESKLENGKRLVRVDADTPVRENVHEILREKESRIDDLQEQISNLRYQLTRRDEQIESLMQQHHHTQQSLDHAQQLLAVSQKSIQQLTQQNQLLLEDQRKPLWRRLFRR